MLIERELPLGVQDLVSQAFKVFGPAHGQAQAEVAHFMSERLVGYLKDQGYAPQEVDAVVSLHSSHWAQLPRRLAAVRA